MKYHYRWAMLPFHTNPIQQRSKNRYIPVRALSFELIEKLIL